MSPAQFTLAPLLRGRRARAPFVRGPRQALQPTLRPRHEPTWAPGWQLSKRARVLDDAAEEVSWDLAGGRSTPVDHAGRPPGSRVPLLTPIVERDADLRGEHCAEARVQLRAPRSSKGVRAFARSPLDRARNLARSARYRSHFSLVANRRRGSINRSPQGAIRGGFAVSGLVSGAFARRRAARVHFALVDKERAVAIVSPGADSFGALSLSAGERSRERLTRLLNANRERAA